jgi:excisionase family DNA binding protein
MNNAANIIDALVDAITEQVMAKLAKTGVAMPRLLNVAQASVYLGRSEDAIRRLQSSGTLRATKLDGRVQFDLVDLDAFIEASKV